MTRFLNLASKALAVVGVLTLMWTAGGMSEKKAEAGIVSGATVDANGDTVWAGMSCYPKALTPGQVAPTCDRWLCPPGKDCMLAGGKDASGSWACCW